MKGQEVVTNDGEKLGTVVAERDDCAIVESGHLFKAKHAIPREFLQEHDGALQTTLSKDLVGDSPKVDLDAWDYSAVRAHYGLDTEFQYDPDPNGLENAETAGARAGVQPAPAERLAQQSDASHPEDNGPVVRDRMANANDPTGVTANLSDKNRTGGA